MLFVRSLAGRREPHARGGIEARTDVALALDVLARRAGAAQRSRKLIACAPSQRVRRPSSF